MGHPFYVLSHFPLADFKICSLSFTFESLVTMYLGVVFSRFFLVGVPSPLPAPKSSRRLEFPLEFPAVLGEEAMAEECHTFSYSLGYYWFHACLTGVFNWLLNFSQKVLVHVLMLNWQLLWRKEDLQLAVLQYSRVISFEHS